MRYNNKIFLALIAVTFIIACSNNKSLPQKMGERNSIYYWRTTFGIDSLEAAFIKKHKIERLYLRMFDVALERDFLNGTSEIVPIATTQFASRPPTCLEIVPVVYITIEALRTMCGIEAEYATLIVDRLLAMATYNKCGEIREIQLDCDWTTSTRESYHLLCKFVKSELAHKGIELSATIRLHQLNETPPPVHRGVLMLYNTGVLKDSETTNSILHIDDVEPYMKNMCYPIPLDYVYPLFGWGVKFRDNQFVSIVASDSMAIAGNEHIRYERVAADDIIEVKALVEKNLGKPVNGNILYHLDYSQLKNYTDDEISEILSY